MNTDKLQKQREKALKASEQLATALAKDASTKRRRRDGRLLKLGVLAEQMFLAGDLSLLSRFEAAALDQYKNRKIDRLDFELDDALNWFDKTREDAMLHKSQQATAKDDGNKPPSATAPSPSTGSASKPSQSAGSRPQGASNGHAASPTSGSSASA